LWGAVSSDNAFGQKLFSTKQKEAM